MTERRMTLGPDLAKREIMNEEQFRQALLERSSDPSQADVVQMEDLEIEGACSLNETLIATLGGRPLSVHHSTFRNGLWVMSPHADIRLENCATPQFSLIRGFRRFSAKDCILGSVTLVAHDDEAAVELVATSCDTLAASGSIILRENHFQVSCRRLEWNVVRPVTPLLKSLDGLNVTTEVVTSSENWARYFELRFRHISITYTGALIDLAS